MRLGRWDAPDPRTFFAEVARCGPCHAQTAAGADVPHAVARAMRVGPNHTDELLYHIANAGPVAWRGPFERIDTGRFGAIDLSPLDRTRFASPERWVTEALHI